MSKLRTLVQASLNATKKGILENLCLICISDQSFATFLANPELIPLYPNPGGGEAHCSDYCVWLGIQLEKYIWAFAWNVDDLMPPAERYVFNFNSKEELKKWHLYSDSEYGGLSSASLEITESENGSSGIFSGNLSLDVSEDSKWNITRSGFCGMRSKKFDGYIDLDSYDTIAMKLKGDGRCYISTIYTENWVNSPGQQEDNSWQAFVFVPKDNWYIAKIPLARYLPTWRGNVIDAEMEMNPSRILGMSLSVNAEGGVPGAKSGPGDFRVELDWIKALRTQ